MYRLPFGTQDISHVSFDCILNLDHFPSFQAFPVCVGILGGKPLKYLEGRRSVFSWVDFPLSIF